MSAPHPTKRENGDPVEGINRHGRRIEEIVAQLDGMPNPAARALLRECMDLARFEVESAAEIVQHRYPHAEWIEIESARPLPENRFPTRHANGLPHFSPGP